MTPEQQQEIELFKSKLQLDFRHKMPASSSTRCSSVGPEGECRATRALSTPSYSASSSQGSTVKRERSPCRSALNRGSLQISVFATESCRTFVFIERPPEIDAVSA